MQPIIIDANFNDFKETLYQIRDTVFVMEQGVPLQLEHDDLDINCEHVLAMWDTNPVGTGRLTPDGHIGRVCVLPAYRGKGIGRQLMYYLLSKASQKGYERIEISAQQQAASFYESIGFQSIGDLFMEAGILHIKMEKLLKQAGKDA